MKKFLMVVVCMALAGCAGILSRSADNLTKAVLEHDDPATVESGAPAYLLLMDSLVIGSPDNKMILRAAADLYSAYGAIFVADSARAQRLTSRSYKYGRAAFCQHNDAACDLADLDFEAFEARVAGFGAKDLEYLFSLAQSWLAMIRAYSADWGMVAELPKAELLLQRVLELDPEHANGSAQVYMGVLKTLRPPALGGKPEEGRAHFEKAIEISGGNNLAAKVQYAESYARLVFDRELHDRLLNEVLQAETEQDGYTLLNVFARQRAEQLLATSDDYF